MAFTSACVEVGRKRRNTNWLFTQFSIPPFLFSIKHPFMNNRYVLPNPRSYASSVPRETPSSPFSENNVLRASISLYFVYASEIDCISFSLASTDDKRPTNGSATFWILNDNRVADTGRADQSSKRLRRSACSCSQTNMYLRTLLVKQRKLFLKNRKKENGNQKWKNDFQRVICRESQINSYIFYSNLSAELTF